MSGLDYKFTSQEGVESFKSSMLAGINSNSIAGLDEVGRGPLAGDVVVACVVLPSDHNISGLKDSKILSAKKREVLAETIRVSVPYGIGVKDNSFIDEFGIYKATHEAAKLAVDNLCKKVDISVLLTDGGLRLKPYFNFPVYSIIKGDKWIEAISAASILAKVYRDTMMSFYHDCYPMYGFSSNQGYGTEVHRRALLEYGPCPIHRRSFRLFKD